MSCRWSHDGVCENQDAALFHVRIHPAACADCEHYDGRARGLGDVIHRVAKATGVSRVIPKSCGCQKRREVLNEIVPNPLK
jgi:hypothetical protein